MRNKNASQATFLAMQTRCKSNEEVEKRCFWSPTRVSSARQGWRKQMFIISLPGVPAQWWDQRDSPLCASWPAPHFFSQTPHRWTPPQRCETPQCSTGLGWRTPPGEPAPQHSPLQEENNQILSTHSFAVGPVYGATSLPSPRAPGIMPCSAQRVWWVGSAGESMDRECSLGQLLTRLWHSLLCGLGQLYFFEPLSSSVKRDWTMSSRTEVSNPSMSRG